jgi:outer membrane receptor protein involved in Fe transport
MTTKLAHRSPLALAIIAALALSAAAPAIAAGTDAAQADASVQAADAPADAEAKKTAELKPVIVTANKREEDIREVAASISAIGQEELENLHVTQLSDLTARVPGLYVNGAGSPGKTQVSLRGLQPLSSGATVGMYLDQSPLGSSGIYQAANFFSLDLLPYDIERIEVLRGPQGTLYGAGAMGGLIKYVTVAPDPGSKEFRVGGGLSTVSDSGDTGWNVRFGGNVPLSDSVALRFSYARNDLPGYIDNSVTGEEDINGGSQTSARAALRWQSDTASFDLVAMRQTIDSDNNAQVALDPVSLDPQDDDLSNSVFVDEPFTKDVDFFSATLDWNLGWANFVSATSWSDSTSDWRQDGTQIYGEFLNYELELPEAGSSAFDIGLDLRKFTQEFRLASNGDGPFQWMAGFFYTKEDARQTQTLTIAELDGSPMPEPYHTLFGTLTVIEIPSDYRETAFFANGSYAFNDVFSLDAGIRYAKNDQEFSQNVTEGLLVPQGESPGASDENVFTWSIGPKFQLSDELMVYGRVATGYQPGGPNVVVEGLPAGVDSSMLTNYEIGLRSQSADRRVVFDATGFYMDWSDIQVATVVNGISGLVNAGKASSKGVELSTSFRATDEFTLGLNAAYTDAQLDEDYPVAAAYEAPYHQEITGGLEGDRLPYVPKWSWSGTADYDLPLDNGWMAHFGAAVRYVGDRKNTTTNINEIFFDGTEPPTLLVSTTTLPVDVASYWSLDLSAFVANEHWTLRGYVKNVTDERGYQTIGDVTSAVTGAVAKMIAAPIQPRTFGFEVDYSF